MIYKFEKVVYGGESKPFEIDVPDYVKFVKYYEFNERQQMWMFMMLYDKNIHKDLASKLECQCYKFGDEENVFFGDHTILFCYMSDVKPLQELPEITIDEFNEEFHKYIVDIYVGRYKKENTDLIDHIYDFIDEEGKLKPIYIEEERKKQIIDIYHFKGFISNICGNRNEPMINASVVSFNALFKDREFNMIEEGKFSFDLLFRDILWSNNFYIEVAIRHFDISYVRKRNDFEKRVNEIIENL